MTEKRMNMEQGHWVLAKLGKRVLRPGGMELTTQMLDAMNISQTDDVVEFAPGLGQTARLTVAHKPHSYTAVELNEEAAERVRRNVNYPGMRVVAADAARTGLPDACATKVYGEAMLTMQSAQQKNAIVQTMLTASYNVPLRKTLHIASRPMYAPLRSRHGVLCSKKTVLKWCGQCKTPCICWNGAVW